MIQSTLEFHSADLRSIVAAFCTLPERLRPTHHGLGENDVGKEILDTETFLDSLSGAGLGPFLKSSSATYDIGYFDGFVGGKRTKSSSIICNCFLEVDPAVAKKFLLHMAIARPVFGFACAQDERHQRNRVIIKQGVNTIESWVGRDTQKYVPGFYWLTLLSEALATTHSVPLSAVEEIALEHIGLEGGQHFFRFYERPEDWRTTSAVATLCGSLPGVFDVEKAKEQLSKATNFLELDAALRNWN